MKISSSLRMVAKQKSGSAQSPKNSSSEKIAKDEAQVDRFETVMKTGRAVGAIAGGALGVFAAMNVGLGAGLALSLIHI